MLIAATIRDDLIESSLPLIETLGQLRRELRFEEIGLRGISRDDTAQEAARSARWRFRTA